MPVRVLRLPLRVLRVPPPRGIEYVAGVQQRHDDVVCGVREYSKYPGEYSEYPDGAHAIIPREQPPCCCAACEYSE